jgi:hypothetical protein
MTDKIEAELKVLRENDDALYERVRDMAERIASTERWIAELMGRVSRLEGKI